jgi:ATP-dependent Clp protease protease subunit
MSLINLKENKSFEIKCKSDTKAEIVIYSAIGESFWDESVSAKSFNKELNNLPKTVNQLEVRLNSPGGDVFDGMVIYNRLKQHKAKITVYIDGLAASIASVIALAGDEIIMGEGALMMIHKPWTMAIGNSLELEETIDRLNDVEDQILGIYQRNTNIDRSELRRMVAEETWLDADQALEHGFATEKMADDDAIDMAASLSKASWIRKKPNLSGRKQLVNNKVESFKNDLKDFLARK